MSNDWRSQAESFLRDAQFHLGFLPTEQAHPKTHGLAETLQRDVEAGVRMLQAVDQDVAHSADRAFRSDEFATLVEALTEAFRRGGRVCFSGCGATGRLSILLESRWRRFWLEAARRKPSRVERYRKIAGQICSIMTGGDYALIRSVENFEDYITFGRRQVVEMGLGPGDVLVGVSEGGETSSVIGTVLEACERGASTFFVFNNPADVLRQRIERSRAVIEHPAVTVLDLSSGPMAVAGSTRMQATTSELLVLGAALEQALVRFLPDGPQDVCAEEVLSADRYAAEFRRLLADLGADDVVSAVADWVRFEADLYRRNGLVTYFAAECLLDIFTDTTERNPTFMLPPFRKCDDFESPPPWAFAKHPLLPTEQLWPHILGRAPRCLEWTPDLYARMGAADNICKIPPRIDRREFLKFRVGNEPDPSRFERRPNAAILVVLGRELSGGGADGMTVERAFAECARPFTQRRAVVIGGEQPDVHAPVDAVWRVLRHIRRSPLELWERLALKLVFNTVSTATMGCIGRLAGNWMVHVEPTNKKLIDRGSRLIADLAGIEYAEACRILFRTMDELRRTVPPGQERPSPVAVAIERLRAGTS